MIRWLCQWLGKKYFKLLIKDKLREIEETKCLPDVETCKKFIEIYKKESNKTTYGVVYHYVDKNDDHKAEFINEAIEYCGKSKSLYEYPLVIISMYFRYFSGISRLPFWIRIVILYMLYFLYKSMEFIDHTWAKMKGLKPVYTSYFPHSPWEEIKLYFIKKRPIKEPKETVVTIIYKPDKRIEN